MEVAPKSKNKIPENVEEDSENTEETVAQSSEVPNAENTAAPSIKPESKHNKEVEEPSSNLKVPRNGENNEEAAGNTVDVAAPPPSLKSKNEVPNQINVENVALSHNLKIEKEVPEKRENVEETTKNTVERTPAPKESSASRN